MDTQSCYEKCLELFNQEEYSKAIDYIEKSLKSYSKDAELLKLKSAILVIWGKYDESINVFLEIIKLTPNDPMLYSGIAMAFSGRCEYNKALEYCEKSLQLEPNNYFALFYKGNILGFLKRYNESIQIYDQILRIYGEDIDTILEKVYVLTSLKNYDEALNLVNEALKIDPKDSGTWITKAKIYHYFIKDLPKAIEIYEYILNDVKEDPRVYYYLKNAYKSIDELEKSKKYEELLVKSNKIVMEKQLEDKLVKNLGVLKKQGFDLKLIQRQYSCKNFNNEKRRIDLLCRDLDNKIVIIELKVVSAGIETHNQISEYINIIKHEKQRDDVIGIIISDGSEEEFKKILKKRDDIFYFNISELGFETLFN